jgi:hypothetical protein
MEFLKIENEKRNNTILSQLKFCIKYLASTKNEIVLKKKEKTL